MLLLTNADRKSVRTPAHQQNSNKSYGLINDAETVCPGKQF